MAVGTCPKKHESQKEDDLYFCFVNFEPDSPTVHVIPEAISAEVVSKDHQIWLDTPGRQGQAHNASPMRRIKPKSSGQENGWMDKYLENWSQITDR